MKNAPDPHRAGCKPSVATRGGSALIARHLTLSAASAAALAAGPDSRRGAAPPILGRTSCVQGVLAAELLPGQGAFRQMWLWKWFDGAGAQLKVILSSGWAVLLCRGVGGQLAVTACSCSASAAEL